MSDIANASKNDYPPTTELWRHPSPKSTRMWDFMHTLNAKFGLELKNYNDLYQWSIEHVPAFWDQIWHQLGIKASQPYSKVVDENAPMFPRPAFFSGAKLNFAENLLFPSACIDPNAPAIIAASESSRESVCWSDLRDRGDRVAGYLANHVNALVAMLAATSVGALWTAVSPDTGVHAVLERLTQIEPSLLFADESSMYNGKTHPVIPKVAEIASSLPSLRAVVIFQASSQSDLSSVRLASGHVYSYSSFLELGPDGAQLHFHPLDPDQPVYILYSSGTTGAPKCIVHGAIGTLIQHKKEHALHCSIGPQSRLFYFTTCTWMMWHWLVSGLASGATLILYDGSPFRYMDTSSAAGSEQDDLAMPRLCEEIGITHFGTSAKYLSVLEQKNIMPREAGLPLTKLEAIYSTGSPLAPSTFSYIYRAFPPTINLGSITGGTDIISLFGAPCPLVPVYEGEIQRLGLGMAVQAWDFQGHNVSNAGEPGDLVCVQPFPCQPVQFWGTNGEQKYKSSYFEKFPGVWHHGDFVRFNPGTGGLVMLGRSDGILKPAGVRFGSAEIYNVLLEHFPGIIADALCIGRRRESDSDETVVLFLKMEPGQKFSEQLSQDIKKVVRNALSARHVPGVIDECPDIPVTTNGKKVEGSVKQILCGMNVKTSASVANAECLDWYRRWANKHS